MLNSKPKDNFQTKKVTRNIKINFASKVSGNLKKNLGLVGGFQDNA